MSIIVAILGLSFLIFFHELGHFLAAKLCHVGVLEFSIGMGPRIFSRVWKNTRYSLKLLPIGGSCAMLGEDAAGSGDFSTATGEEIEEEEPQQESGSDTELTVTESSDLSQDTSVTLSAYEESTREDTSEQIGYEIKNRDPWIDYDGVRFRRSEIQKYSFQDKPAYQRFFICIAGVLNNFILAAILAGIIVFFCGFDNLYVAGSVDNAPAATAGFEDGDSFRYLGYHDKHLSFVPGYRDLSIWLYINSEDFDDNTLLDAVVIRNGEKKTITFKPYYNEENSRYMLGLSFYGGRFAAGNLYEFLTDTFYEVRYNMTIVLQSLGLVLRGKVHRNEVMGPVGAVTVMGTTVEKSTEFGLLNAFLVLLALLVMLSSNLGIMNLLPIPALDGGRLIFILFEMISRKRLDPDLEGRINQIGMIALLALMAFIMSNDIWNIVSGAYASILGG
ncbi:M50 family metallopeptidase [Oribacterium sp. WCC10]|uniref:M50 family metallopeptidase n=1 Tax=Oribacterium sp. WCC10 TaxID=1855343 RepID=UPI0008E7DDCA|nr:site-2 protease family protein [Oribacterium sp. WCC10]SFG09302.1 regulator of sigma E protease [Oribacterium sp. WCC10]